MNLTFEEQQVVTRDVLRDMIYEKFGYGEPVPVPKKKMGGVRNHDNQIEWTYIAAIMAVTPMVPVNHTGFSEESDEENPEILLASHVDVEREVIKRDLYSNLSVEAKYVVQLILSPPEEWGDRVTIKTVIRFLKKKKWKDSTIDRVAKELKSFVESF